MNNMYICIVNNNKQPEMSILISNHTTTFTPGYNYASYDLSNGTKACTVTIVTGKRCYVNVIVKNAAHAAYRGTGKEFDNLELAYAAYKDAKIKAMIAAVAVI